MKLYATADKRKWGGPIVPGVITKEPCHGASIDQRRAPRSARRTALNSAITLSTYLVLVTRRPHPTSILSSMGRYHSTSDAHFEVGDRVLVRGVPACVRMETATQVLVVFDAESQEEWVPKSSPALTLARDAASSAAKEAAAAAPPPAPVDPAEELSSDVEDDECCVRPSLPFPNPASEARLRPPPPPLRAHGLRFSCGRAGLRQWRQADVLRRVPTRVPPSVPATGRPCLPAGFGRPGRVVVPALPPAVAAVVLHVPHPVRVVHAARVGGRGEGGRGALRLHGRRAARRAVRRAARGGAGAHGDDGARAPVAVCRSWAPT